MYQEIQAAEELHAEEREDHADQEDEHEDVGHHSNIFFPHHVSCPIDAHAPAMEHGHPDDRSGSGHAPIFPADS